MGRLFCLRADLLGQPPLSPFKGEARLPRWDEDHQLQGDKFPPENIAGKSGAGEGIRTLDPNLGNAPRSLYAVVYHRTKRQEFRASWPRQGRSPTTASLMILKS